MADTPALYTLYARALERKPLPRYEILFVLRFLQERKHCALLGQQAIIKPSERTGMTIGAHITAETVDDLYPMGIYSADDFCNKTAPFYVMSVGTMILAHIFQWLYDRWLVPWRSDIEWGQFVAKIITVAYPDRTRTDVTESSEQIVNRIIKLNSLMCQQAETTRQEIIDEENPRTDIGHHKRIPRDRTPAEVQRAQEFFILQPLFRAISLFASDPCGHFDTAIVKGSKRISQLPVYIIRTGVTDGLSAPITLESISMAGQDVAADIIRESDGTVKAVRTSLEVAYNFLRCLEQREIAAFGQHPDPFESTKGLRAGYVQSGSQLRDTAGELGWKCEWDFPEGPSSQWVPDGMILPWAPDVESSRKQRTLSRERV